MVITLIPEERCDDFNNYWTNWNYLPSSPGSAGSRIRGREPHTQTTAALRRFSRPFHTSEFFLFIKLIHFSMKFKSLESETKPLERFHSEIPAANTFACSTPGPRGRPGPLQGQGTMLSVNAIRAPSPASPQPTPLTRAIGGAWRRQGPCGSGHTHPRQTLLPEGHRRASGRPGQGPDSKSESCHTGSPPSPRTWRPGPGPHGTGTTLSQVPSEAPLAGDC